MDNVLDDLIFVASNTQRKWGTLRNIAALPDLYLPGAQLDLAEQLSRLADYITYLGRTPREVAGNRSIQREIAVLSDGAAQLVYHHISEIRGVLTNLIQNAALDAWRSDERVPLLYAPSGVVYLARKGESAHPALETIADDVVKRVKMVAGRVLSINLTGFGRDGKGLKHAAYYRLFFDPLEMLAIGFHAAFKIIHENKNPSAGKRFAKLTNWMDLEIGTDEINDVRVDQLAEWCYLAEKIARPLPGGAEAPKVLIEAMGLTDRYDDFMAVPRDTRAGGVGYHWYFVAGYYLERNRGLDPQQWQDRVRDLARELSDYLKQKQLETSDATSVLDDDGFDDLRKYVQQVLSFGSNVDALNGAATANSSESQHGVLDLFAMELERYDNAKRRGRGSTAMCSLCSSPFSVMKQQESAILFAPQVYSNKLSLHGSNALRDICSICGLEMMLRQLLMNRTNATGGRFEGRNLRYLYFYPTYFFTPETLALFRTVHDRLKNISFTVLRKQLLVETDHAVSLHLNPHTWQRLEPLIITPDELFDPDKDRYLRMQFPKDEPITFHFLGVPPPGRDSKDAEAWVQPAFLALLLPLCVDVKVVASESSIPVLNEANELAETVFLDGAHAAIGYIVHRDRVNLDQVLPTLNRLAVSYLIQMDGNAKAGANGYDYRWQDLPALARHLSESPLYAFWYLKKWQRNVGADTIPGSKATLYLDYYHILTSGGEDAMSHARTLTELYRQFYRGSLDARTRTAFSDRLPSPRGLDGG